MNILKDTSQLIAFVMIDTAGTEVTGLGTGFTVTISKAGGAFAASAGTKSEIGNGWYTYTLTASETDTAGALAVRVTGTGAVQQNLTYTVTEWYWATDEGEAILAAIEAQGSSIDHRQMYCTVDELFVDMDIPGGDIDQVLRFIGAASQTILQEIGNFLPITEVRYLDGNGLDRLMLPPLLDLWYIDDDGVALGTGDYLLWPHDRHWPNGPYTYITHDPDGGYSGGAWTEEDNVLKLIGSWGLYFLSQDTGEDIAVGGITSSGTELAVSDGSKVSPGMVLRIESEDVYVSGLGSPTTSVTTVASNMTASDENVALTDGTKVKIGEIIRIGTEKMKVIDIATNTAYVRRGYHRTKPAAHSAAAAVDVYRTPTIVRGVNGTVGAVHTAGNAIYRLRVPEDVSFLCREIASLMLKKAQSGYAGRTGNEQTGVTYYNDAFPRFDLDRVKEHYRWSV